MQKNKNFLLPLLLAVIFMLTLTACRGNNGATETKPPDLNGNWKQSNGDSATYQTAIIQDNTIEVYWVNDEDSSKSLYWAGTYAAPTSSNKTFSWDSVNDKEKTGASLLASKDEKKTFSYDNGEISYEVSAMRMTKTVKLKKQ